MINMCVQVESIDKVPRARCSCRVQAMGIFTIEKDIAAFTKKEFDQIYNPTWHCIVGRNFGAI